MWDWAFIKMVLAERVSSILLFFRSFYLRFFEHLRKSALTLHPNSICFLGSLFLFVRSIILRKENGSANKGQRFAAFLKLCHSADKWASNLGAYVKLFEVLIKLKRTFNWSPNGIVIPVVIWFVNVFRSFGWTKSMKLLPIHISLESRVARFSQFASKSGGICT